ncbi:hypothetical protein H6F86_31100 [Phormidium sp. FACHB-592]|uniref:Plasmid segregation centromere-binding protein ParR n=1 Tax=Stenomitos frigidus AS-A4 TaxID=2933935 RepID=A0ABV0KST9_9CYAN|nr:MULTISPECIES: hypothetical protein [Cyanophyceae]MBD2034505.1 hypothetical protein [Leptolyngbya sp. FACHB-321]MBD2078259.1 hypothetical protein [Phormidium sp. FACHB-592]
MPNENGQAPKDNRLRLRLQSGTMLEQTVNRLKDDGRDKERQRLEAAICAFWAPYAYQDSETLQEVALQSILDLSDQILEIALLANLPIDHLDPMRLKANAVSLKQLLKNSAAATSSTESKVTIGTQAKPPQPTSEPTNVKQNSSRATKPSVTAKPERESLFDD